MILCYLILMYQERELTDISQTSNEMYRLAFAWKEDMAPYASMSLSELFDKLKSIPFHPDPDDMEYLQRPWYTLGGYSRGGDCDDKAIATGAWANLHHIPFRFVAVQIEGNPTNDLHHVYTELYIQEKWIPFDPTYAFNVLGRPMGKVVKRLVL